MKKTVLVISAISFLGCAAAVENSPDLSQQWTLEQGLLDKYSSTGSAEITQQGNSFTYKANGQCSNNAGATACMWWGVRWSYPELDKPLKLHCNVTKTVNKDQGNKRSWIMPSVLEYRVVVNFPAHSKQQLLVNKIRPGSGVVTIKAVCETEDKTHAKVMPRAFDMQVNFGESSGE